MSVVLNAVSRGRAAFKTGKTLDIEFRKKQIQRLLDLVEENEDLIVESLKIDLGKPRFEAVLTETDFMKNDILGMLHNIDSYVKKKAVNKVLVTLFDDAFTYPEPFGLVLILGTWNYPIQVTLSPLVGAIAAGNVVILKPSEIAPSTADLLVKLIPRYLDEDCYQVLNGGPEVAQELLKNKFDFIFYTGSAGIGQKVHMAAATHLTPACLELGGKSPVYIDDSILVKDMELTCRRILWGKLVNAGQTCVAPDYILCSEQVKKQFLIMSQKVMKRFYNGSSLNEMSDMTRIVNDNHYERLSKLLDSTKGQKMVIGYNEADPKERLIPLTLVTNLSFDDVLMKSEIFGPILPILTVKSASEAIDLINSRDKPLTLYLFTKSESVIEKFITKTSSGSVCVNDDVIQMILDSLPFGGVGMSGFGSYHGYHSFKCFSHQKSVLIRNFNPILEWVASKRYPPYSNGHLVRLLRLLKKRKMFKTIGLVPFKLMIVFLLGLLYGYFLQVITENYC